MLLKYFTIFKVGQDRQCNTTIKQSTEVGDMYSNSTCIYSAFTMYQALC